MGPGGPFFVGGEVVFTAGTGGGGEGGGRPS
jgi:hypothetical protein